MVPDSGGPIESTDPEPPSPARDHVSAETGNPMPHVPAGMSPTEDPLSALRRADETIESAIPIDRGKTWGSVIERIKWVMDTLSPIAQVRVIAVLLSITEPTFVLSSTPLQSWHMDWLQRFPRCASFVLLPEGVFMPRLFEC